MKTIKTFGLPIFFVMAFVISTSAQVLVSGSSGANGSYATLKAAFDAVNATAQTGNNIDIAITANITETATAELLAGNWASLVIHPSGAARTIQGNLPDPHIPNSHSPDAPPVNAVIKLHGADNVTIDGSLAGGTDRSLTITNTAGDGSRSIVVLIKSGGIGNGADNNTVKNTILTGSRGATVTLGTVGILSFNDREPNNYGGVSVPNSNNIIQNNLIKKARFGMHTSSAYVVTYDPNWAITGNTFGSTIEDEKLSQSAITLRRAQNFVISNNTINGIYSNGDTRGFLYNPVGIGFTHSDGGSVIGNKISDLKQYVERRPQPPNFGCAPAFGIAFGINSTASTITIANNFIWDLAGLGFCSSDNNVFTVMGIYAVNGKYDIFNNSVNLNTNSTKYHWTAAIVVSASQGSIDLRNNIFANTATIGNRYAISLPTDEGSANVERSFSNIDYNDYYAQSVGLFNNAGVWTTYTTLADWRAFTGQDLNSKAVNPLFVSPTDLHLQGTSPLIDAGTNTGIFTDIDGQVRPLDTNFDIGADEYVFTIPATATIGGRVLKSSGQGLKNANVTLSGGTLSQPISVTTGNSGAYQFPAVSTGQTYLVSVTANGYTFANPTQVIYLTANVADVNFTAN